MAAITELRSFNSPARLIQEIVAAVAILLGQNTDWNSCKKMMSSKSFFASLL